MELGSLAETDRDAAVDLWERCGLTRPWNPPHEDFDRALAGPSSTVLGLLDEGRLVGSVMVGHDGHRGWVYYLAVDPGRRTTGLGHRLMAAAEDWLTERGVPKLNVMVRGDNAEATAFYEAIGYERSDVAVLARTLPAPD